ncbi:hypothetical protein CBR_g20115 [Chara braunii]|uniref:Lipocalin/cytosolic fatty-acid binding domain-containing protein n=1 Tax=Chara braunii TaxID=69332 RepID=A0A388KZJ5_CHABU|nr:hypothetical protein CBR_g20115 [Chara braunii]|eukprot:GBG75484.1 hypothetical protein CBR_g20115 [Chara braunii]
MAVSLLPRPPSRQSGQGSFPLLAVITLLVSICFCCDRVSSTSSSSGSTSDHLHRDPGGQALSDFCTFQAPDRQCPVPPTVASVDVNAYTGLWFEVAISARFKILSQRGIRCATANYTADGTGPYIMEEINKITSLATVAVTAGSEIWNATKTLYKQSRFISKQDILRPDPDVRAGVLGRAVQSPKEPGKLTVTFRGFPGAYWIIALEGRASEGYEVAMVYGCQVLPPFLQTPNGIENETIFIIARKRDIPRERIDKLVAYAKGVGINLTLDNILIPASFDGCSGRTLSPAP